MPYDEFPDISKNPLSNPTEQQLHALATQSGTAALFTSSNLDDTTASVTHNAVASCKSQATTRLIASVIHEGIAELVATSRFTSNGVVIVNGDANLHAAALLTSTGIRTQNIIGSGGATVGGTADVEQPVYFYTPANTKITIGGAARVVQQWSYTATGDIPDITGAAVYKFGYDYVPEGDISFTGQQPAQENVSFTLGFGFFWELNQAATASFNFSWNIGTQQQFWFRVVGQCKNDSCPPLGGDGCPKLLLMTIQAANINEVCTKIQSQFGVWPIQSIQVFSIPATASAVPSNTTCNTLTDVQFCNVPVCADLCVQFFEQEFWGFQSNVTIVPSMNFAQSLSLPVTHNYKAQGKINFGGSAKIKLNMNAPKTTRKIKLWGSAHAISSSYHHKATGGFNVSGTSRIGKTHWKYRSSFSKKVDITQFDIEQRGHGTPWNIGEKITNNFSDGPSKMLVFSNIKIDDKPNGIIFNLDKCANAFVRDVEVVTMSGDRIVGKFSNNNNWPLAIAGTVSYGGENNKLGFIPGEPFSIGIRAKSDIMRNGLLGQISNPRFQLVYDTGGRLKFGGNTIFLPNFWKYKGQGGFSLNGTAKARLTIRKKPKIAAPQYPIVFDPKITSRGVSKTKQQLLIKALDTSNINTNVTFIPQAVVPTLTPPTNTINACQCTGMPLSLNFSHNLATSNNKLQQFLTRNGITIPSAITIDYNTINNSWQANLHYQGASSAALNSETWVMIFELQCTNLLGGTQIGVDVWRFAIKIMQRNLQTNELLQTRLMVAFLPTQVCANGIDFRFVLTFDTQMQVATLDPASTIYEVASYDSIGLFKTAGWISNPDLVINMTQIPTPLNLVPIFIGSNS
jgi:hypothetical protein